MESNYWASVTRSRMNRRRVLAGSASFGLGAVALSLIGCGGSNEGGGSDDVFKPADTTSKAAKGGIRADVWPQGATFQNFDPFTTGFIQSLHSYSRLLLPEMYKYPEPVLPTVRGDAAISWERPDPLTYVFKIRPGQKFDSRAPTNGRAMTAQDVVASWNAWAAKSTQRAILSNAASKSAPIASMEAVSADTVMVKNAFAYAPTELLLASDRYFQILPAEAFEDKFDTRNDMRGSGTWKLKNYVPGNRVEYEKNPDWYDASKVSYDGLVHYVVTEPSAGMALFRDGQLWTLQGPTNLRPEEVLPTKQAIPELLMKPQELFDVTADYLRFGYLPGSPFLDERVRQAASMLLDRDLFIETFNGIREFTAAGIDVGTRWNTAIPAGWDGFWLDPKDTKAFGENAKYFKYDPAEAKKLMQAAGHTKPLETKFSFSPTVVVPERAEVLRKMFETGGDFKLAATPLDYTNDFRPNYAEGGNKHEGIIYNVGTNAPDLDVWFQNFWRSGQPRTGHTLPNSQPDTELDALIDKRRAEQDIEKRFAIVKDLQKYAAGKMYLLHSPGSALNFDMAWPWIGNWGLWRSISTSGSVNESVTREWFDASKKKS